MDKIIGENNININSTNNTNNDNLNNGLNDENTAQNNSLTKNKTNINDNSVDNQMNTSLYFGRKRFFNRKPNPDSNDLSSTQPSATTTTTVGDNQTKKSSNKWPTISASNSSNQLNNINNSSNGFTVTTGLATDLNEDKFLGEGIQFNAKLIGHEFVAEARGEHMCQQSIKKLKILQRGLGGHKRKVHIFISFDGIKIRDSNTSELIYHHSVPQISFISRDETDSRAFGYVFGSSSTGHQFIALKTQKEAMPIMSAIGQLFAATLIRKKSEIIGESVANNEDKSRRESSITLRPSPRSESPNVPSMPAPPPPTTTPNAITATRPAPPKPTDEIDFFSAFEPMDSVFETDFKVDKEKLDQMPMTGTDSLSADPFASSFGSLSLSSGDWANFDDETSNASPLQQSQNNSTQFGQNSSKFFGIAINNSRNFDTKAQQMANSFNDSSSSMALRDLFSSGHHNQINSSSQLSPNIPNTSDAVAIPARVGSRPSVAPNQSVGSTASSSDRYACFAEIHSISSSIFDSLCDQIAAESECQQFQSLDEQQKQSKSLNSSLNGRFGEEPTAQHQMLSSSLNQRTGHHMTSYYSFDNPLNSELQKQNFLYYNTNPNTNNTQTNSGFNNEFQQQNRNSQQFETNFFNTNNITQQTAYNDINAQQNQQNSWFNSSNNFNQTQQQSTPSQVWSTSSSMSGASDLSSTGAANSQLSVASSPPPPTYPAPNNPMQTTGFGINRSQDMLNDVLNPVFAELDPLGKDRPFIDRSQFFAEQKQKPTLRDLNPTEVLALNMNRKGTNSPILFNTPNETPSIVSSARRQLQSTTSTANPFSATTNEFDSTNTKISVMNRLSPNPFNPFNTTTNICAPIPTLPTLPNSLPPLPSQTPPPPAPPPRPPSRECPSVPPRNDLMNGYATIPVPPPPTPPKPAPQTPELAPPLPRRRTTLTDSQYRYQSFDSFQTQTTPTANSRQTFDPFNTSSPQLITNSCLLTNNTNTEDSFAPPLPNPQRKVAVNTTPISCLPPPPPTSLPPPQPTPRKQSIGHNWDPFNCAFVDSQLASNTNYFETKINPNLNNNNKKVSEKQLLCDSSSTTTTIPATQVLVEEIQNQSTPKQLTNSTDPVPKQRHFELKLSEIKSSSDYKTRTTIQTKYDWINETIDDKSTTTTDDSNCSAAVTPTELSLPTAVAAFPTDFSFGSTDDSMPTSQPTVGEQLTQHKTSKHKNLDLNLDQKHNNFNTNEVIVDKFVDKSVINTECNEVEDSRGGVGVGGTVVEVEAEEHVSPPERNIFIVKSDPFADEFFAD